ncbi:MAG: tetratricopeptide repeat protein [Saccharospirillaceae bacterium]|nr:tetratricopeptide repeat protein [Pseudomonadales bacterium]NRB79057.1 tetratricopeptide repeat protein [Saccharospirillaceae bacterium]
MSEVTEKSLIKSIGDNKEKGRRFAFLLGAGASITSGIKGAGELAQRWLEEIKETDPERHTKITSDKSFDKNNVAACYTRIYQDRFKDFPDDGYREIEELMSADKVQPSFGYTVLAQILNKTRHNVVLTTNFDRLTETALLYYQNNHARVIAHEEMLSVIAVHDLKPTIVKIHRDMQFSPMSEEQEVKKLDPKWNDIIRSVLSQYSLVCLGYGGNDNGLMEVLKKELKNEPKAKIYWCYRGEVPPEVQQLSKEFNTQLKLVNISGFDEFMLQLNHALKYKTLSDHIKTISEERQHLYNKQLKELTNSAKDNDNSTAINELLAETWWEVQAEVNKEKDIEIQDQIFQKGLEKFPISSDLNNNYALFLTDIRNEHDKAEDYYQKVLKSNPEYANTNGNYALFLTEIRKDYDKAEDYYHKTLKLSPISAGFLGNYANFLSFIRKDYGKGEEYYQKALELNPKNTNVIENYAVFLTYIKKDYAKAEEYYHKALKSNPEGANINCNYAGFLLQQGDIDTAKEYLKKSEEIVNDPRIKLELAFYRIALFPESYTKNKAIIEKLLAEGHTSSGWDFTDIITQADKQGNTNLNELKQFAEKISAI